MKNNSEELSVGEVLSSIRTAVLENQSSVGASDKKNDVSGDDVFVLTKDMLAKNVAALPFNKKEFSRTSIQLIRKYAKAVTAWQVKQQNKGA